MLSQARLAAAWGVFDKHLLQSEFVVSLLVAVSVSLTLSGCTSLSEGPARLYSYDAEMANLRSQIGMPDFNRYFSLTGPERQAYRNNYVRTRMYAMDMSYTTYEASLTTNEQAGEFLAAATNIALTTTSSLITPVSTKDILSGTASALTGVRAAYNEKVLLRNTIQLLQTQMRANRALVASRIFERLRADDVAYPLPVALSDLEDYYRAGTLPGAAIKAQSIVSENEQAADLVRQNAVVYHVQRGAGQAALRNNLTAGGQYHSAVEAKIQAELPPGVTVEQVVWKPELEPLAEKIARKLGYL